MDTWTRQMGYPVIMVREHGDHFILDQRRFLISDNTTEIQDDSIYGYIVIGTFSLTLSSSKSTIVATENSAVPGLDMDPVVR